VELTGAVSTASLIGSRPHSDGASTVLQVAREAANDAGIILSGIRAQERDIDGCTVHFTFRTPRSMRWESVAGLADAIVQWTDRHLTPGMFPGRANGPARTQLPQRALWSHTVLVCEGNGQGGHTCSDQDARSLLPTQFETVREKDDAVFLGLHASLVCLEDSDDADRIVGLIDELHGWWSATWLMDQALLDTSLRMTETFSDHRITEIREATDLLVSVTGDVGVLRSRLDTFRLSLGGLEWPVWEAASKRWALDENLAALERKRQLLLDITTSFRDALESHRSARLNQLASFFAVVSSLASFVAVVLFLFPTLDEPGGDLRLRVFIASTALTLTLAGLFWSSAYMLRQARSRRAAKRIGERLG
jgi:hypothetical protein